MNGIRSDFVIAVSRFFYRGQHTFGKPKRSFNDQTLRIFQKGRLAAASD